MLFAEKLMQLFMYIIENIKLVLIIIMFIPFKLVCMLITQKLIFTPIVQSLVFMLTTQNYY